MSAREQWLINATSKLREGLFKEAGLDIPTVRLSIGFPGGGSDARKTIGQYWHAQACQDGVPQIFVSPTLDSPVRILDVLVHELVHAVTPGDGHGKLFRKAALAVGLTGKMTATVAGEALEAKLVALHAELGEFPHAGINLGMGKKKQTTRLLKVECTECGYTARVTSKWIEASGAPICPCNGEVMNHG